MKRKSFNIVKNNLPYKSIRHIKDNYVIKYINQILKKKDLYKIHSNKKIVDSFLKNYINWISSSKLNKFKNLNKFKFATFSNGTSQTFDMFYLKHHNRRFRLMKGEYAYHFLSFRNHKLKWKYIEDDKLSRNDALIISLPFSDSGNIHEQLGILLNECSKKKIPVLLDCCYLTSCKNINFNFDQKCIETITFSLSKCFPVSRFRIGMRLQKEDDDDPMYVYQKEKYLNLLSCYIGNKLINKFNFDYIYNKYAIIQKKICEKMNLKPSSVVNLALGGNSYSQYNRGGKFNRLCISNILEKNYEKFVLGKY
jgi:hypothetical protein